MKMVVSQWIQARRGMAGLVVAVLVLGLMMEIAVSHSVLVQNEVAGVGSRAAAKKAYFAALSGIHFAIIRLRSVDATNTFSSGGASRLYFAMSAPDDAGPANNHYSKFGATTAWKNYSFTSGEVGQEVYYCDTPFSTNTPEADPSEYRFMICSYPGTTVDTDYWVKSQGIYKDLAIGAEFKSQVWAFLEFNNGQRTITLKKFGPMAVQSTTDNDAVGINDFWDWQDGFF